MKKEKTMDKIDLGISQAEIRRQVISAVVEKLYDHMTASEIDGGGDERENDVTIKIQSAVQDKLSKLVLKKVESAIVPLVKSKLDSLMIPQTNRYGEPKGEPMTFLEFAVQKAEQYMTEQVDFDGRSQNQRDGYSWKGCQTRITHMVHQHLHYSIETAMKKALADANSKIVKGIEETCKIQLGVIASQLKMEVKTSR